MAISEKYRRLLNWAGIGGVLSMFLAHAPPEQRLFIDRFAYHVIEFFVWAFLGAVAAILYSFFKKSHESYSTGPAKAASPPEPQPPLSELVPGPNISEAIQFQSLNREPISDQTANSHLNAAQPKIDHGAHVKKYLKPWLLALNFIAIIFGLVLTAKVIPKNPSTAAFGLLYIAPFVSTIICCTSSRSIPLVKTSVILNIICGLLFFGGPVLGSLQDSILSLTLIGLALTMLCAFNIKFFWSLAFFNKNKV